MESRIMRGECSETRLRSFLNDRLPEPETSRLADHLDHCEPCRKTLEQLAAGSRICAELRGSAPETVDAHVRRSPKIDELIALDFLGPSTKPGSLGRLGPYDVKEVLGRGAFGVVLKAFDPELSRFVAIKVLAAPFAVSAAARGRFAREARAAAAVVHENVVAIHAVDSWNGLPYLVMPCIAGRSLQERVDRDGPLAVKEVLRVGMQAALGLAAAHDQGLVHRDVKPSNILLENGVERVKLSDFGLARAVDDASQTQSGVIAGTPQYMSPEQARGEPVDHRSDLFSLGGVMYFMCAGRPPFRADSTPAVLRRVCDDRPRPLRDVNPDVPDWLAAIVDRLLAKNVDGRFATASEVADVLKHHLAELQRTGTSAPLVSNVPPPVRKRPRMTMLAGVVAASVVLFGLAVACSPNRPLALASSPADGGRLAALFNGFRSSNDRIIGSGVAATKVWDVADFTLVQIGSAFRAEITQGDAFKVTTSSDDNVVEHLRIVKEGKTLKIGLEPNLSFQFKEPLKAQIVLPMLEGLDASGSSRVALKGFRSDSDFKLHLSGASKVEGSMEVGNAVLDVSGSSHLTLAGSAGAARLNVSGASRLELDEFLIKECEVKLSGSSHIVLAVLSGRPFKASASGASHLEGSVDAADVTIKLDGSSVAKLRGKAASARLDASGASRLDLAKLAFGEAAVKLTGSSHATVDAQKRLTYDLSAASRLEYAEAPTDLTGKKERSSTIRRLP
ncbi:MAG: DUF2807 domain-containing protein [Paludisphaera borealis]|uniref:protein kinase domain-containing protein n=1 Tax=Paludisphaera borealis TaxID=1387353 RepID=UPI002844EE0F|nr:DUF2807 domain-containing protein [Paludisphaera borealis]MDR3623495.1 DUF2807 domain-containing protein [Paludisphaera borealis]